MMVRDPYWLHAYWELRRQSVERARAALGQDWHGARPVLRLVEVTRDGTTSSVRKVIRDVEIHGGVVTGTSTSTVPLAASRWRSAIGPLTAAS